jgi:hypothetical protein
MRTINKYASTAINTYATGSGCLKECTNHFMSSGGMPMSIISKRNGYFVILEINIIFYTYTQSKWFKEMARYNMYSPRMNAQDDSEGSAAASMVEVQWSEI